MVSRFKRRFWFFLLMFVLCLNCPGYPKSIKVENLPASHDMDRVERDYGDTPLTLGATDADGDCVDSACLDSLKDTVKCNKCVDLEEKCPGCCLEDVNTGGKKVRCPDKDSSNKSICGVSQFYETDCDLEDCEDKVKDINYYDNDNCRIKCRDYKYKSSSVCGKADPKIEGTSGELIDDYERTYGLQRAGCPDEDSDLLAPDNDDCSLVKDTEGKGLDRKWKCEVPGIIPEFAKKYVNESLCSPDSSLTFTYKPDSSWGYGDYYAVTKVEPNCAASYECSSSCSIQSCSKDKDGDCYKDKECPPSSCVPKNCHTKEESVCSYSCVSGTACATADKSTYDCECDNSRNDQCTPDSCKPSCSRKGCEETCSNECTINTCQSASNTYYVYVLSDKYKGYIKECVKQADEYEKCINEFDCCREGVCPEKTDGKECNPGFDANCDLKKCEKLVCYYSDCKEYIGKEKTESCAHLASDANDCMSKHKDCFEEIDPEKIKYDFVARRGDSLTIIWQIDVKSANDEDAEGVNFYTLVKVFELDGDKNPTGDPVHTSMMNVKNLEANFTIYGTTNTGVDSGELKAGKFYRVRVYYFLPNAEFCDKDKKCEGCAAVNEVEVSYISLTLVRARE